MDELFGNISSIISAKLNEKDFKYELYQNYELIKSAKENVKTKTISVLLLDNDHLKREHRGENNSLDTFLTNHKDSHFPIVTIGTESLENLNDKKWSNLLQIDQRYQFLDSSIWHYYVSPKYIGEEFTCLLDEISNNYKFGLYNAIVAREFNEFQRRNFKNVYLENFNNSGHSNHITPSVFHSETKMKEEAKDRRSKLDNKLRWKVLLIDDYADQRISSIDNPEKSKSKKEIIEAVLREGDSGIKNLVQIDTIVQKQSKNLIKYTLKKLSKNTYDVIFLDFLLGEDEDGNREYSHELLQLLNGICEEERDIDEKLRKYFQGNIEEETDIDALMNSIRKKKGPLNKFWLLNISSFQTAFLDRLTECGLGHNNDNWYLSKGADPVSTPQLFRYKFYDFLYLQQKQMLFLEKDLTDFLVDSQKEEDIKKWARQTFGRFVNRFYVKDVILKDAETENGSELANRVKEKIESDKSDVYRLIEHIRHLLYLLAFDAGENLNMAWQELNIIKGKMDWQRGEKLPKLFNEIEEYIAKELNN